MFGSPEGTDERSRLLSLPRNRRPGSEADYESISSTDVSEHEQALSNTPVGERLPYNDYKTIDWLHDLVKDSYRYRSTRTRRGVRYALLSAFNSSQGWIAAVLIGSITAFIATFVDVAVVTVSDWKFGYCKSNPLTSREDCCAIKSSFPIVHKSSCTAWHVWSNNYWKSFSIYVGWALLFGIISGSVTVLAKRNLPATTPGHGDQIVHKSSSQITGEDKVHQGRPEVSGKTMYMVAGSGIPEIKTILSGFVIPHFLDLKVLVVKAAGLIFAAPTGLNLGKEGPFIHISACVAYLVAIQFPKYRDNDRKLREMLSAGCASGLCVAFGAPIGGVLFTYEEISTYFPRKVLWRAFICSLSAAIVLRVMNPTGTGRLILYETNYGTTYRAIHYVFFVVLGIAGGIFGSVLCKANFLWSRTFRKASIIKTHPVFEVFLVVLVTVLLQYPNSLARDPGDIVFKNLLADCRPETKGKLEFICQHESAFNNGGLSPRYMYLGHLLHGTLVKFLLTIITFGTKVPGGVIIPSLEGGAFFGRLVGQLPILSSSISPGIFAMVGAGAFLAGVSRITVSLAVIMFEMTGEVEYIVPNMIGIMVAKWIADFFEKDGIYDIAQTVLGHPFLELEYSMELVQRERHFVSELNPPKTTMHQITVEIPSSGCVSKKLLIQKLEQLKERGLMDAGFVLIHADRNNLLAGYITEAELDFGLNTFGASHPHNHSVRLLEINLTDLEANLPNSDEEELNLSQLVDRTPLTISESAPMEYALEMFGRLGLRHLIVTELETGRVSGVIIKKRLVAWLNELKREHGLTKTPNEY